MSVLLDPTLHTFASDELGQLDEFVRDLGSGNEPLAVMVTCSHLGLFPDQIAQANPGELCIIQDLGNTIPPLDQHTKSSIISSLQLALDQRTVRHVIVCGHIECDCLKFAFGGCPPHLQPKLPQDIRELGPYVQQYYPEARPKEWREIGAREHVLRQMENLRTYTFIRRRIENGSLRLHGWVLADETALVSSYDPVSGQFLL